MRKISHSIFFSREKESGDFSVLLLPRVLNENEKTSNKEISLKLNGLSCISFHFLIIVGGDAAWSHCMSLLLLLPTAVVFPIPLSLPHHLTKDELVDLLILFFFPLPFPTRSFCEGWKKLTLTSGDETHTSSIDRK